MPKEQSKQALFEQTILPHIDAAYNMARWIVNNDEDAQDLVQESYLRAYKYFSSYQGGNSRSWLLTIVRNTCYTWLQQNRAQELNVELNEETAAGEGEAGDPAALAQVSADRQAVADALARLPVGYRELVILREQEGMSYKEIALIAGIPIGTVMSRLARARQRLKECLVKLVPDRFGPPDPGGPNQEEGSHGL